MGSGASKGKDAKQGGEGEAKPQANRSQLLDKELGYNRPAIGYNNFDQEGAVLMQNAETVVRDIERFTGDTKKFLEMKAAKNKKPAGKSKAKKAETWRDRVKRAEKHAVQIISSLQVMNAKFEFSQASNFLENINFFMTAALGDLESQKHFVSSFGRLTKDLMDAPCKVTILPPDEEQIKIRAEIKEEKRKEEKRKEKEALKKKGVPKYLQKQKAKTADKESEKTRTLGHSDLQTVDAILANAELLVLDLDGDGNVDHPVDLTELNNKARMEYETEMAKFEAKVREDAEVLQTLLNRSNAKDCPQVAWTKATVSNATKWTKAAGMGEFVKEKRDMMVDFFRSGAVVVQILAAGSFFRMPDGRKIPLWTADPYMLAEKCLGKYQADHAINMQSEKSKHAGKVGATIQGLTIGPRHLASLVLAVTQLIGPQFADATIKKLKVILHISAEMEQKVVADLKEQAYFGLSPANIVIILQPQMPGFTFDEQAGAFVETKSPLRMYGTGFAMQQLAWEGEGYILGSPSGGSGKHVLAVSAMQYLKDAGVEYMLSNRLNDMRRLEPDNAISTDAFCHLMFQRDKYGAAMQLEVEEMISDEQVAAAGSVVLGNGDGADTPFVCEVPYESLRHPDMVKTVKNIRESNDGKINSCVDRYIFHLPTLLKVLASHRFAPRLKLEEWEEKGYDTEWQDEDGDVERERHDRDEELTREVLAAGGAGTVVRDQGDTGYRGNIAIYPLFDMADITQVPRMRCIACCTDSAAFLELKSKEYVEKSLEVFYEQDSDLQLHNLLEKLQKGKSKLAKKAAGAKPRHIAIVFCSVNDRGASLEASKTFIPFLTEGVDMVKLVHVVKDSAKVPAGQKLLMGFEPKGDIQYEKHVLVRPPDERLVDFMCFAARHTLEGNIVVMGSEALSSYSDSGGVGSISLAMLRQCRQTIYMHKAGSYLPNTEDISVKRSTWLLGMHQNNLPLLDFACTLMSNEKDALVLARVTRPNDPEDEEMGSRIIEAFTHDAVVKGKSPFLSRKYGHSPADRLVEMAKEELCSIIAVQAVQHLEPTEAVQNLVKQANTGVLIYKRKTERKVKTSAVATIDE